MTTRKLLQTSFAAALFISSVTAPAAAGSVNATTIQSITVTSTGFVTVLFTNIVTGRPACAVSTNEMVFDSTSSGGRSLLSTITGIKLSGRSVSASGANSCTGPRENMSSVSVL